MKIVHLQYGSSASGNYTITLHDLMRRNGIESSVLSLFTHFQPEDKNIQWFGKVPNIKARIDFTIQKYLNRNNKVGFGNFSFPILGTDVSNHILVKNADVIYVHWVLNGYLNLNSFRKLAKLNKPVVFLLHDMWSFTGGCHYSLGCEKYIKECKSCHILPKSSIIDRANLLFKDKLKFFQKHENLYFIAPSIWARDKGRQSRILQNKKIEYIPNSVSPVFSAFAKGKSKKQFSLNPSKKTIGFGANYVNSPFKGFSYLMTALDKLSKFFDENEIQILIFGYSSKNETLDKLPFDVVSTGYLSEEKDVRIAYSAMDVFVTSSIAETGPVSALESLSCGVPVVSFNVGGLPQMIDHKTNGFLASNFDSDELAEGIRFCLKNELVGYIKEDFEDKSIINKHKSYISTMLS